MSILPVDQGIEHSAAASFAPNPAYFDPMNIVSWPSRAAATPSRRRSACSGAVAARYAHRIPFIVKLNHNELLTYPNKFDQIMFGSVQQAWDLGAAGVGATIYFGSEESTRQLQEVSRGVRRGPRARHVHGAVVLPAQHAFKKDGVDYTLPADLTGQANHLGVTIEADIIKQKPPENNGGYTGPRTSARPRRSSTTS